MSLYLKDIVGNIFYTDKQEKAAEKKKQANLQHKVNNLYSANGTYQMKQYNPFLDKNGQLINPYINYQQLLDNSGISQIAKNYISQATGLTPTQTSTAQAPVVNTNNQNVLSAQPSSNKATTPTNSTPPTTPTAPTTPDFVFNGSADENNLAKMDVSTELPKLSEKQIAEIISKHFSKSTVIKPSDAKGIYDAQQTSGMSALAILGIGALESGYGTSSIAQKKNNIWGWGATNDNPGTNAKTFSQMSQGALEFANAFLKTYYNGYGAKSIYSAGTGDNPSGKGYAYYDNGTINKEWANSVGSIMRNFYKTAKSVAPTEATTPSPTSNVGGGGYAEYVGKRIANTSTYNNSAAKGQCVWFVRGRATEKLGKDTGAIGNANEMYDNAKADAKLSATVNNIKPNIIVSYGKGTSSAGQKYGHVIFIEDVVGDTVYYTEGGSGYYKNGTDGVVKTATRQGILDGVNSNGTRMGSEVKGFIDMNKY